MPEAFEDRYFQLDFARERVFHRQEMLTLLDLLVRLEYNGLAVYMLDSQKFERLRSKRIRVVTGVFEL